MLLVFKTLWDKFAVWIIGALAVLGAILKYGYDKKQEGARDLRDKINKETQDVEKKWTDIDRSNASVDDALDRLSRNSKD